MGFDKTAFTITCARALTSILRKYRVVLFIPHQNGDDGIFIKSDVLGNIEQIEKLILRLREMKSREDTDVYFLVYETDFTIGINLWDEYLKFRDDFVNYDILIEKLVSDMCYILDKKWYQLLRKEQEMFPIIKEDNWWDKTYREMMEKNSIDAGINIGDYM